MRFLHTCIIFFLLTLSLYGNNALFSPIPTNLYYDKAKVALGRELFFDTRLSKDNTVSCASCHDLLEGGDDGLPVSFGIGGKQGVFNAPTIYNSTFNFVQFWDGRARDLHEQVSGPIHNPVEMGSDFPSILQKLTKDQNLVNRFKTAYKDGLTKNTIIDAIVAFEKTLITPNSKFDKFLIKKLPLSQEEMEGYRLFVDYGCASCHNGVNLGGNLFQKIGIMKPFRSTNPTSVGYLKVPSLRNITLTAPYFHDGSVASLHDAIKLMFGLQLGIEPKKGEIEKIYHFLQTLKGELPETLNTSAKGEK